LQYRQGMEVRAYVESHASEFTDDLQQWLAIPSVPADPAAPAVLVYGHHAPNEHVDLSLLPRGAEVSAYLWQELAAIGPDLT
jgi:hypothetical protein